jgi:hypothetical protein
MTYPPLPTYIDSTMRSCFVSCPQKYFREFVEGYRPPGISVDLHAGACFAGALEEIYKQVHGNKRPLEEALLIAQARFFQEWGAFEIPEWKKTAKTPDRMWEAIVGDGTEKGKGYFEQYSPLTDHVQPYFDVNGKPTFEYTFAIPLEPACQPEELRTSEHEASMDEGMLPMTMPERFFPLHPNGSPFLYTGRFDMLGSYLGKPVVRDEKTTGGSIGANWADQWDLRSQFMGYVWACQQLGLDLDTVVVRGIAIQKTQIVHAEAIKTYSKFMIDRWYEQLRRDLWRLRRSYDEKYFDFNLADACTSYGNCIFQRVCQSSTPENWLGEFEIRHWNPLDKNPAREKANA